MPGQAASGGEDNTATLWNVATGGIVQEMTLIRDMNLAPSEVFLDATAVAWSPDGMRLIVGGEDGSLRLWDLRRETEPEFGTSQRSPGVVLVHPDGSVVSVTWSPGGEMIASSSIVGTVAIQGAQDLHSIAFLDTGISTSVSWDPISSNLVIANEENPFEEVIVVTSTPVPTLTPTPTPTPTPSPTPTPAAFQRLRVTAMCSDDPATSRRWRIRNPNPYPVPFTWEMRNSPGGQQGTGTAPVAVNGVPSAVILTTATERWIPIIELSANNRSDFAINLGIPCDLPSWLEP